MGTMEIIIVNPGAAVRIKLDNAENGTIQEECTLLVPSVNSAHRPVTPFHSARTSLRNTKGQSWRDLTTYRVPFPPGS